MKLRNKKSGWICELECITLFEPEWQDSGQSFDEFYSIAELNENWEDYKPAEPLIKDEKIRKAVRAWAEANDISPEHYYNTNVKFDFLEHRLKWIKTSIEFNDITGLENLEGGESYTIAELCGEPVERDFEETRPTGGEE